MDIIRQRDMNVLQAIMNSPVPVGAIQLSKNLDVPPANIGRILLHLENNGLVEKIQNKGRVITSQRKDYLNQQNEKNEKLSTASEIIDTATALSFDDLMEILQVRSLLEPFAAGQCAKNVTPQSMRELENLQLDYKYELRHGNSGSEEDLKLHLKIAELSGNNTLCRILKLILADKNSYDEFTKAALKLHELSLKEHDLILQAIFSKNGELAKKEMKNHIIHVINNVKGSHDENAK